MSTRLNHNKGIRLNGHGILSIGILCLFVFSAVLSVMAESKPRPKSEKRVLLLHSDILYYDQRKNPDAQILCGNVTFRHEDVMMYCDSACFYQASNSFDAFGNVRMEQGDTLSLVGDVLYYDGFAQLAKVRHNVVLKHRESTLHTDSLDYDRLYDLGYFFEGGTLQDGENVLISDWGEYSPTTREAIFNYNVRLENPQFLLQSDTLHYNTRSSLAHIVGPSNMNSGDNHIYSESGYYDTRLDRAYLLNRSVLTNNGKQMIGDSLFYDNISGVGEAFGNVFYKDELNKNMFTSHYCYHNEKTGYSIATDSAVAIDYSQKDTMYMHADTFKVCTYHLNTDSMYREVRAYNKVRAYRIDIQAVCDSLVYNSLDSCMTMYKDPIVWNGPQQLLGEEIKVFMSGTDIDSVLILNQTLSVEQIDSVHFNQIAGFEMRSFFENGDMKQTWVSGNVYLTYYPFDDDSLMIGMNYTETTEMKLYMAEDKIDRIWMPAATGVLFPLAMIPKEKMYLENFAWFDYIRPLDKHDIFVWRPKRRGTELKKSVRHTAPLQKLDQIKRK